MGKILCGVPVDDQLYQEYMAKTYYVPGDIDGMSARKLKNIIFFANNKEYVENCPEFVEECKKIISEVAQEIKAYYTEKSGHLCYKVMRHDSFSKYIDDLVEIAKEVSEKRHNLKNELEKSKNAFIEAKRNSSDRRAYLAAELAYYDEEKSYKNALEGLREDTLLKIGEIRDEFHSHLSDFYTANANRIDENDVRLFNSGIRLRNEEIDVLLTKHRFNPTMLRLISQHCEKVKLKHADARVAGVLANSAGRTEKEAFEQVVELLDIATDRNEYDASIWLNMANFNDVANTAKKKIDGLWVRPEVITGGES